jgi:hypothetical protein
LVTQVPRKQAEVVPQVETAWYCSVTVMGEGVEVVTAGQTVMMVKVSWAMAVPAMMAAAATAEAEKRMAKQV